MDTAAEKKPSDEQIETFLKNWMSLTAIQYRTIEEEFLQPKTEWIYEGEDANKWYPCIRAADQFIETYGKYPSPGDAAEIRELVTKVVDSFDLDEDTRSSFDIEDRYIEEM